MVWNTPGDQKPTDSNETKSPNQDPWTGRPKSPNPSDNQGPPMLDEALKKLFANIQQLLKNGSPSGSSNNNDPSPKEISFEWVRWGLIAIVALWFFAGLKQISSDEQGIVLRLGRFDSTLATGWHWRPWGLDKVIVFDRSKQFDENVTTDVLSQDLSLAQVSVELKYHVNDPTAYLFNYYNPVAIIRNTLSNSIMQTSAEQNLDSLFANNRDNIFLKALQTNFNNNLNDYNLGIKVDSIQLTGVAVPDAVKEIFNKIDALYVEQNKQKQQASDYEQQTLPPAQAKADQMIAEAKTYAAQAEVKAQEDVADFLTELPAYQAAPALTKYRLYMRTMKAILERSQKVIIDSKASPVINLPAANKPANTAALATPAATPMTNLAPDNASDSTNADSDSMYSHIKGGYQ